MTQLCTVANGVLSVNRFEYCALENTSADSTLEMQLIIQSYVHQRFLLTVLSWTAV